MANSYLSRDFGSAGNQKTMTFSWWYKSGGPSSGGQNQCVAISGQQQSYPTHSIRIDGSDRLYVRSGIGPGSSNDITVVTTRKFMDTTSWYHFVVAIDTTQATDTNRVKLYVNGVQETQFDTAVYSTQNYDSQFNRGHEDENIGRFNNDSTYDGISTFTEGHFAHYHFVDGTALTPSTFGETDSTTGEWKPKLNPSVTYGTNGFFLKFENAGALGTDSSGNTNTWTVNGDVKQSISTPSNNFCTLDYNQAYDKTHVDYAGTAFLGTSTNARGCASTQMVKNGKWYVEFKPASANTQADGSTISIAKNGTHAQRRWRNEGASAIVGKETGSNGCEGITYQPMTGTPNIIDDGGGGTVNYGSQASANDIIMMAVDLSAATSKIWFGKNGTWFNAPSTSSAGDPANGNYPGLSFAKGDDFWGVNVTAVNHSSTNYYMYCNFGEGRFGATAVASANADGAGIGAFEYSVPSGFYAICTKNIKDYG